MSDGGHIVASESITAVRCGDRMIAPKPFKYVYRESSVQEKSQQM